MQSYTRILSTLYVAAVFAMSLQFADRQGTVKTFGRTITQADLHASYEELKKELARRSAGIQVVTTSMTVDEAPCLSEAEVELRMAVLRAASEAHVEYGDYRNPAFWIERDGLFFPKAGLSPCDALSNVGSDRDGEIPRRCLDGIYCTSLAQILIMQGHLSLASSDQRFAWDAEWRMLVEEGNVIPNDIPGVGETRFWLRSFAEASESNEAAGYAPSDLLPGDNIYIENPFYTVELAKQLEEQKSNRYRGEEGSNVFYLGAGPKGEGLLVHPFSHEVYTLDAYKRHMIEDWPSIRNLSGGMAHPSMFRITSKRSPLVTP